MAACTSTVVTISKCCATWCSRSKTCLPVFASSVERRRPGPPSVLTVPPFGNSVVTLSMTGDSLLRGPGRDPL